MSIFVPLAKLQSIYSSKLDQITKDLTVESVVDEEDMKPVFNPVTKKFALPSYQYSKQRNQIQAYKIQVIDDVKYVAVPYAYYFHHLSEAPRRKVSHEQRKMRFVGTLLDRQAAIKDQTVEILNRTGSILLCLHTGFGKTIFTLYLLSKIGMKTLVLCHRAIIIKQWTEAINKYLPDAKVKTLQTKDVDFSEFDIVIANPANVCKLDMKVYESFGCLIVDEVHTICTQKNAEALRHLSPSYLLGLSATPARSDGMDALLELYLGPEMVNKPLRKHFHVYKILTPFVIKGSNVWTDVISQQAKIQERNEMICKLIWFFSKRNILVLVKLVEHANILRKMLEAIGEDVGVFMEGMKQVNYSCRVLIATFSKGGVGFDHPKLDMLIGAGDVEENFVQYLGRIFRRDDVQPIYIDIKDKMKSLHDHSMTRLEMCEELGGKIYSFKTTFKRFEVLTKGITF